MVKEDAMRKPIRTTYLSQKQRTIGKYEAQLLNTLAFMFDSVESGPLALPARTLSTVNPASVKVPRRALSKSDSATYKELHTYITGGDWDAKLQFPRITPQYHEDNATDKDESFLETIGRPEWVLYFSFKELLDNSIDPV